MAYAQDVIHSTLVHLMPKFEELFQVGHPVLEKLHKGGKIEKVQLKGPTVEFTVVKGGPGSVDPIRYGNETLGSVRRNQALRGSEQGFRAIYHFDIPNKDLAEASGEHDFARLIDQYPAMAMADMMEMFARQLARGSFSSGSDPQGTGMDGFTTLNGLQSYNPQGTARSGIFQFATSQTSTVHGLPCAGAALNPTPGWAPQHGSIGSFSVDGLTMLRKLTTRANQQGAKLDGGGIDLLMGDEASFHNYVDALDDKVIVIDNISNPAGKFANRECVKAPNGADFFWEPAIDLTDTTSFNTAATQSGVVYGLATDYWVWFNLGNNSDKATKGNFDAPKPIAIPNQDAWHYRIVAYANLYCRSLRNQFTMTGGALP